MSFGLPPVSIGLKSIAPYLQRAEELVNKEPVVAYWCAYYAAQLGINLKAKDTASRTLLLNLLNALERLKAQIGPNDAIHIEAASAAYVENFALRVFSMADDEDREGHATRSTAKKFLAAANFFEVLKVFPKTEISDAIDDKIKYSKWKAADIAKAYREGRKPTPGPAGSQFDLEPLPATSGASELPSGAEESQTSPPVTSQSPISPQTSHKRQSPKMSPDDIARANLSLRHDDDMLSPGRWSTTATPGFDLAQDSSSVSLDQANNWHEAPLEGRGSQLHQAWVSTDMEGATSDEEPVRDPVLNDSSLSQVLFSPSADKSRSTLSSSPPKERPLIYTPITREHVPPIPPHPAIPPSSSPPRDSKSQARARGPSVSSQERIELPPGFVPSSPAPMIPIIPPPPMATIFVPHSPRMAPSPPGPAPVAASSPPRDFELTPTIIAKAQKHCRFAISSLDYEDAEQARKELKAALALLGD
ncbi:Vta1 like-domain-containing protein [Suillus paluster]|uniref:Vta1 like-domain-containing protein n=1 Tax=Suillus paluster TaxID=48578 RepID=UPI001B872BC2|nr:Vta1 like-domain-containing protein [Suillus paluster]KAG1754875.1 Vta1 like-domain-containing protein [Suillus paluster]